MEVNWVTFMSKGQTSQITKTHISFNFICTDFQISVFEISASTPAQLRLMESAHTSVPQQRGIEVWADRKPSGGMRKASGKKAKKVGCVGCPDTEIIQKFQFTTEIHEPKKTNKYECTYSS